MQDLFDWILFLSSF